MLGYCLFLLSFLNICYCRIKEDQCITEGGTCVMPGACNGWVETFDRSCGLHVCCKPAPVTSLPEPPYPDDPSCGKVSRLSATRSPLLRVVGGSPAQEGQWPWQVSIVDSAGNHFCGGTLVTSEFVVTAAHCFNSYTTADIEVVLGEHHLQYNTGNEIRRKAYIIVKHGHYSMVDNSNDIAFLQLESPVNISGHYVRTACLPTSDMTFTAADTCYVSGWGYTKGAADSRHLQELPVTLISNSACGVAWGTHANITNLQMCAGTGLTGTCKGDSGGPLVCLRNGRYYLAGVTSFGYYTCMQNGYPDVFSRMTSYIDWLTPYMLLLKVVN